MSKFFTILGIVLMLAGLGALYWNEGSLQFFVLWGFSFLCFGLGTLMKKDDQNDDHHR